MAARRLRFLRTERAGRTRDCPRASVDAFRAARRCGRRSTAGPGGRRAELTELTIRLEPLGVEHVAAVEAMLDDPDNLRFTRVPEPVSPRFAQAWLEIYEEERRTGTREAFAIVGGDGEFLGLALAPKIDRETRTAELGYVVAPEARGRGVATGALRRLTAWAFDELEMFRLELLISVDNVASKKVAERCGYVREGVLRSAYFKQGLREDTEIWSRLATDP
jgi:RimJ/RimL family protein N-acetyltransferase